jgi:nucleotide-binding universal stress UspA family protein
MRSTAVPVVVGIDGSESSRRALGWSLDEARVRTAVLVAVMCEPDHASIGTWGAGPSVRAGDPVDHERLQKRAAHLVEDVCVERDTRGVEIHIDAYIGRPSERLIEWSGKAQLLVVGARGYDRVSPLFLGSVARAVTQRARCAVVLIP